jgi:hypothetical protein
MDPGVIEMTDQKATGAKFWMRYLAAWNEAWDEEPQTLRKGMFAGGNGQQVHRT